MNDFFNRRQFLTRNTMGIGSLALAWLLQREKLLGTPRIFRAPSGRLI